MKYFSPFINLNFYFKYDPLFTKNKISSIGWKIFYNKLKTLLYYLNKFCLLGLDKN